MMLVRSVRFDFTEWTVVDVRFVRKIFVRTIHGERLEGEEKNAEKVGTWRLYTG